jgi:hypothetical protein
MLRNEQHNYYNNDGRMGRSIYYGKTRWRTLHCRHDENWSLSYQLPRLVPERRQQPISNESRIT